MKNKAQSFSFTKIKSNLGVLQQHCGLVPIWNLLSLYCIIGLKWYQFWSAPALGSRVLNISTNDGHSKLYPIIYRFNYYCSNQQNTLVQAVDYNNYYWFYWTLLLLHFYCYNFIVMSGRYKNASLYHPERALWLEKFNQLLYNKQKNIILSFRYNFNIL